MKTTQTKLLEKIAQIRLARMGYWVAYPEVYADANCGVLDVVGAKLDWSYKGDRKVETIGIEIKVSRGDYFSRKQRFLDARSKMSTTAEAELGTNYKYFLVPKGLIAYKDGLLNKNELYEGWGLMEFDGKKVITTVKAPRKDVNNDVVLYSMARLPLYHYHRQITKLMTGYKWLSYEDIQSPIQEGDL